MSDQRPTSFYPKVPIDPVRQIRVLSLQHGDGSDEISCHLSPANVDAGDPNEEYDALSYTWGRTWKDHKTITLQGQPGFPVTANLYSALRRLRTDGVARRLWIDQICINQNEQLRSEKEQQIPLMGRIYNQATQVIVWLGDCPDDIHAKNEKDMRYQQLRQTRAWVIQEYVQARNDPVFYFGSCRATADEVLQIVYDDRGIKIMKVAGAASTFHSRHKAFERLRKYEPKHDILSLLPSVSQSGCYHGQDKVFSIISLLPDVERSHIKVNYDKTPERVFADATNAAIQGSGTLDILAFVAYGSRRNSKLPSWVLDFNLPVPKADVKKMPGITALTEFADESTWATRLSDMKTYLSKAGDSSVPWCQSKPVTKADTAYDEHRQSLRVKGLEFDRIASVIPFSRKIRPLTGSNQTEVNMFQSIITMANPYDLLNAKQASSFSLQSCKASSDEGFRPSKTMALLEKWDELFAATPDPRGGERQWAEKNFWKIYMRPIATTASEHGVLVLTRSGFFGLATTDVRAGDVVVLPHGSRFPVVVSSENGSRRFRGLIWVHGIMRDELYRKEGVNLKEVVVELV
ncbi:hypothetical protein PRZ48_014338 [Zasmidium cellare]|uniref:Heterokaryon incompatibility domain-containing protein n=1 Tax=Zasmidium cellare TaxID=395010 RepID=A0ABR0E0M6_ZASCE|nr:hypothetical protein PRZ48_014338 [Zasmidium cellare]